MIKERSEKKKKHLNGRWAPSEHDRFMSAIEKYGRNWIEVQKKVRTRSIAQVRSHAQKVFLNMSKEDVNALFGLMDDESETHHHPRGRNGHDEMMLMEEELSAEPSQEEKEKHLEECLKENIEESSLEKEKEIITNGDKSTKEEKKTEVNFLNMLEDGQNWGNSLFMKTLGFYRKHFEKGGNFMNLIEAESQI